MKELTQHQKIITLMARTPERWFRPSDFMQPGLGELFVGYEASARLSELAKRFPTVIESRAAGKYIERRLLEAFLVKDLDSDLMAIVIKESPARRPARPPEQTKLVDVPAKRRQLI